MQIGSNWRPWKPEEDRALLDQLARGIDRKNVKIFNRSPNAVETRCWKLGHKCLNRAPVRVWTHDEDKIILEGAASGLSAKEIAERFPIATVRQIRHRLYTMRLQAKRKLIVPQLFRTRPPEYVLEDRDRRAAIWPDLNQRWLGDPMPGQSALDRMRA